MKDLSNRQIIVDLATGSPEERKHIAHEDIHTQSKILYDEIWERLETLFDLTLLEGALETDEFHNAKKDFEQFNEDYGYIHAYIERSNTSNTFRFQYRRPTATGNIVRKNLTMNKSIGGYSPCAFKNAGHYLEKELCILTEKKYLILRKQSKLIRSVLTKLRLLKFHNDNNR
ncbi:MAG: hypothetical protein OEY89_04020 [Gammaproteobacteria bacterium]|nr:hypothetical protein [Gammaproteobacteria bacterium]